MHFLTILRYKLLVYVTFGKKKENYKNKLKAINENGLCSAVKKLELRCNELAKSLKEDRKFYLYTNEFEKKYACEFFDYIKQDGFLSKYKALIKNLDDKSIATVGKIISRLQLIEYNSLPLDLFDSKEAFARENIMNELTKSIVKISETCFAWRDYLLPVKWFESCVFYNKHCTDKINKNNFVNKDIIDAGGFIGDSILILSTLTKKKVYSFEPSKKSFETMQRVLELNGIKNAICENVALGVVSGEVEFYDRLSCSSIKELNPVFKADELYTVPIIKLDDYVKEHNLEVGLIKTDLEGAELDFLLGAKETITTQRPTLLISIYHTPKDFFEIKPLIESWNLGYTIKIVKETDDSIFIETLLIAEVNSDMKEAIT